MLPALHEAMEGGNTLIAGAQFKCNRRIERFFLTFKEKVRQVVFDSSNSIQPELDIFNIWYNQLRTHENIGGFTPKEIWCNKRDLNYDYAVLATAWDGVLTGYYFPD